MTHKIKLSMIAPVYNTGPLCIELAKQVLSLKSDIIEIIFIDDGSRKTESIKAFENPVFKNKLIQVVTLRQNRGASNARNLGVSIARGEFIWFFDSDDRLGKDFNIVLAQFADQQAKNDLDIFILNYSVTDSTGHFKTRDVIYPHKSGDDFLLLHEYVFRSEIPLEKFRSAAWRYFIKRDFLIHHDIVFPRITLFEDVAYICDLAARTPRATLLSGESYLHIRRENSTSDDLIPPDIHAYYSDNINSSLSIIKNIEESIKHDRGESLVFFLGARLLENLSYAVTMFPFWKASHENTLQWRKLISTIRRVFPSVLDKINIKLDEDMSKSCQSFIGFVHERTVSIPRSRKLGIYCVSGFSMGCAKILIDRNYSVCHFVDETYSRDIEITPGASRVPVIRPCDAVGSNIEHLVIINRSQKVCRQIFEMMELKKWDPDSTTMIHMDQVIKKEP